MRAIEFVNKFGICEANKAINKFGCTGFYCHQYKVFKILIERSFCDRKDNIHTIDMSQVKQIVDAFELVESYGSIDDAKNYLDNLRLDSKTELEQALNLVEQC